MLIRSRYRVVGVYILCVGVCDQKGYADWECKWCRTRRCCIALLQNCLKVTPRCKTCRSLICLMNCIVLSVFIVDVSVTTVCSLYGNIIQKSLYCFEHALHFRSILNERDSADIKLRTSNIRCGQQLNFLSRFISSGLHWINLCYQWLVP